MFFGAGNLIFPPYLGFLTGTKWWLAGFGFLITGVGLPLFGVVACAKINGTFVEITSRVGKVFSLVAVSSLVLAIGPMLAIPRTAATTYELAVKPLFLTMPPMLSSIVYFIIVISFVLKPSAIVDNVGKVLTPILLIMLTAIIFKALLSPIGPISDTGFSNAFSYSLLEGYQTMDAMAAVIFSGIILSTAKEKGYKNSELTSVIIRSSIIASVGLAFVYGGLLYLGSQSATLFPLDISRTTLLTEVVRLDLGTFGTIVLAVAVSLACLTTAIGLLSTAADYFSRYVFNRRISYNTTAIIMAIISAIISVSGVDTIVRIAIPMLTVLYPIVIILIALTLMGDLAADRRIFRVTVGVTTLISLMDTITNLTNWTSLRTVLNIVPLASSGFIWLVPTIIAFCASYLYATYLVPTPSLVNNRTQR
ncbi:MAG: branched-chain amino acid transport system II carrier protein [Christensenellaceae bacterium]|nr:branched-chain amino acid transport system II carrier protein [Christensenellaceae bacterium]